MNEEYITIEDTDDTDLLPLSQLKNYPFDSFPKKTVEGCPFYVQYIGKQDFVAIKKCKTYEVMSVERGWYRIMTELDEDYLFPPSAFKVVSKEENIENCE